MLKMVEEKRKITLMKISKENRDALMRLKYKWNLKTINNVIETLIKDHEK